MQIRIAYYPEEDFFVLVGENYSGDNGVAYVKLPGHLAREFARVIQATKRLDD